MCQLPSPAGTGSPLPAAADAALLQGPFDAAVFNAVFGNLHNPHDTLARVCFLLRPGRWERRATRLGSQQLLLLHASHARDVPSCAVAYPSIHFRFYASCAPLPCSYVVISHPLGRPWHESFRAKNPQLVPNELPQVQRVWAVTHGIVGRAAWFKAAAWPAGCAPQCGNAPATAGRPFLAAAGAGGDGSGPAAADRERRG